MPEERERRSMPRTQLADRPAALVRRAREVRLLDLSLAGTQIEHRAQLHLAAACSLELRPPGVVRGGLRFRTLTAAEQAALAD